MTLPNLRQNLTHLMDGDILYDEFTQNCAIVLKALNANHEDENVKKCIDQMKYVYPELTKFIPRDHDWFKILPPEYKL